jgi:antirestriction protein ArdC
MSVYEIVTKQIIEQLDQGTVPWKKPWQEMGMPMNLVSRKPYSGINVFLLGFQHYAKPYWLTMKQGNKLGGKVRKGEKSTLITFWKFLDSKDKEGKPQRIPLLRYYRVFNVAQFDDLKLPAWACEEPREFDPIESAEAIVKQYPNGPPINFGGDRAYYRPASDEIQMPNGEAFTSPETYYSTLFHEMGHSTGHSSRLDRGLDSKLAPFGSEDYSKEELIAEFCSAFLSAECGINQDNLPQHAAYIAGWRKRLEDDPKLIIQAASKAQRAANWVLGKVEIKSEAA